MEGLRDLAQLSFEKYRFARISQSEFNCHSVHPSLEPGHPLLHEDSPLGHEELAAFLGNGLGHRPAEAFGPTLRLVCIPRDATTDTLCISRKAFLELTAAMSLDPQVLYLITHEYEGFHHSVAQGGNVLTGFVGTAQFSIVWTFNVEQTSTRMLLLVRSEIPFPDLGTILHTYRESVGTPLFPVFAMIVYTVRACDNFSPQAMAKIQNVEEGAGYGPNTLLGRGARLDIDRIALWLKQLGEAQSDLSDMLRHLASVTKMISFLEETELDTFQLDLPMEIATAQQTSLDTLREPLPLIQGMVDSSMAHLSHVQDRSRNLGSLLFTLLTHEDAAANIALADTTYALTQATQRDGSSMKTIAIMTMTFLPAIFFAALFTVPLLRWDQEHVVQPRFWIYWIFTILSTALVFVIWFVVNNYRQLRHYWGNLVKSD